MFQVEDNRYRDGVALTVYAVYKDSDNVLFLMWDGMEWKWHLAKHYIPFVTKLRQ